MNDVDFSDLEGDFDEKLKKAPSDDRVKYPCAACAGTGVYQKARIHQEKSHCFACRGRGYFYTSEDERKRSRAKALERKQNKLALRIQEWEHEHAELNTYLNSVSSWNNFAASLLNSIQKYGSLTNPQLTSAYKMMDKHIAREAEKLAELDAANDRNEARRDREAKKKPTIDLTRINELFAAAKNNGLKKPVLRMGDFKLSLAPDHGRNPGFIYVKLNDDYVGKISPAGKLNCLRDSSAITFEALTELAKDPLATATQHGHMTGSCALCGRRLTNETSVELGIGPICRAKWGL